MSTAETIMDVLAIAVLIITIIGIWNEKGE